jgi:hypothetical protein
MVAASCTRWRGPGKNWAGCAARWREESQWEWQPVWARVLTVPLVRAHQTELPDAALAISEGLSVALQESLVTGRLDIAVLYNAQPGAEIDITPLVEEDLLLVQRRPHGLAEVPAPGPITLRELAELVGLGTLTGAAIEPVVVAAGAHP